MAEHALFFSPSEPDPVILDRAEAVAAATRAAVVTLVAVNFAGHLVPVLGRMFVGSWRLIGAESAFLILFAAVSLHLSNSRNPKVLRRIGLLFAILVALSCTVILIAYGLRVASGIPAPLAAGGKIPAFARHTMSPLLAAGYALLGLTIIFIPARQRLASYAADLLTALTVLLVLTLASGHFLGLWRLFAPYAHSTASSQAMLCLLLLTGAAFLCRAEYGLFSIFLGPGAGSRIVRYLAPVLFALPYLRETLRARLIDVQRMPPHYLTALLASMSVVVAFGLLLFVGWYINRMEAEIRAHSLRDSLTGLYNLEGFRVLAAQTLRLAHRSGRAFSVLFIDLDNLKQTNDSFGHQAGSALLVELAEILTDAFRESDVLGRIGGDEFAVAGQFSHAAIVRSLQRLEESAQHRNARAGRHSSLRFSAGYATSEPRRRESLDELLAKADHAMYEEKRRKKVLAS